MCESLGDGSTPSLVHYKDENFVGNSTYTNIFLTKKSLLEIGFFGHALPGLGHTGLSSATAGSEDFLTLMRSMKEASGIVAKCGIPCCKKQQLLGHATGLLCSGRLTSYVVHQERRTPNGT